ncbi:GNAT family N-acetyltransferase [Pedobacter cryoconitis]|uniref:Ribosomal protein S18 acetylase RimI-like enzyme n=1 Tax=Pedobacter cryoconitis TaxID=188932 RepID=A0A7X0MHT0_9SPHI|nr:GNAT family N-acetyltransferase [Pedobacter cryoconitis]MBB6499186.1 ribosomal protein S18 acetylase RimI-like enzyme [Pedobacter cryoconitis]
MPITKATPADIPALNILVNSAYRGEESKKGWTTEADLLGGIRIDEEMLHENFSNETVSILKYTDDEGQILGSVYLEIKADELYLGMFSVSPVLQNKGIGKALLEEAEVFAKEWNCRKITMTVIRARKELISWYERRGYTFTGEIQPFAGVGRFGEPKQELELIVMEKAV